MLVTELPFSVRSDEVDRFKRATLSALAGYMQEVAYYNSAALDAGVEFLQSQGTSWVLLRFKLDIQRFPLHRERIFVQSWPSGHERTFVYRDYRIRDEQGHIIAEASSTWIVLDLHTRHMISVPEAFYGVVNAPPEAVCVPRANDRLKLPHGERQAVEFPVRWHDIDANAHVSNFLFFQWPLEAMSADWLNRHELRSIDLMIRAEANYGESIRSEVIAEGEGTFFHQISRAEDGKEFARARSRWKKNLPPAPAPHSQSTR